MNRYLFDKKTGIMAIVRPDGTVTFHKESGFVENNPATTLTQNATVAALMKLGYVEGPL